MAIRKRKRCDEGGAAAGAGVEGVGAKKRQLGTSTEATAATQPSRKGKKNWRRNIDITQVDEDLAKVKNQERLGGVIAEKKDADLFVVDTTGDEKVRQRVAHAKPSRIDEILRPQSSHQILPTRLRKKAPHTGKKKGPSLTTQMHVKALAAKMSKTKSHHTASKDTPKNLWDNKAAEASASRPMDPYVADAIKKQVKTPSTMCRIPESHSKPVEVPHPGASYNPTFQAHQEILQLAVDEEETKRKKNEKSEALFQKMIQAVQDEHDLCSMEKAIRAFFDGEASSEEDDDDDAGDDEASAVAEDTRLARPMPTHAKKTKAERNRAAKARALTRAEQHTKRLRRFLNSIDQAPALAKRLEKALKAQGVVLAKRAEQRAYKEKLPKRLSKHVHAPEPIQVQLSEELSDALRTLVPEGNLFTDRFKSMQKRNLIETRVRVGRQQRYKRKTYEKHSYKNFK